MTYDPFSDKLSNAIDGFSSVSREYQCKLGKSILKVTPRNFGYVFVGVSLFGTVCYGLAQRESGQLVL